MGLPYLRLTESDNRLELSYEGCCHPPFLKNRPLLGHDFGAFLPTFSKIGGMINCLFWVLSSNPLAIFLA